MSFSEIVILAKQLHFKYFLAWKFCYKLSYHLYASVTLFAIKSNFNVVQPNSKSLRALFDLTKHCGDLGSNSPDVVFY